MSRMRPPTVEELIAQAPHQTLESIVSHGFQTLQPAERLTVTQAAEKWTRIGSGGGHSTRWSRRRTPYLQEPQDVLNSLDYQGMIFVGPARTGKALDVDTPMATPTGWTTMGKLRTGEFVFGSDGRPTKITFATEIMYERPCYEIKFSDGNSLIADAEHQWEVRDLREQYKKKKNFIRVATTQQLVDEGLTYSNKARSKFAIRLPNEIEYPEKDLLLDPYLLGLWLGDGSKHNATISVGREDLDATVKNITDRGYKARVYEPSQIRKCFTLAVMGPDGVFIDQYLSTMGFDENTKKSIPTEYMTASPRQRRELLRGLMDTDGTVYGKQGRHLQFVSVDADLTAQVRELVASLGYKASTRVKPSFIGRTQYKDAHLVEFTVYDAAECFALPRKIAKSDKDAVRRESQTGSRFIASITPVKSRPVRCIQVDAPDHLFLAGRDYIVTHNTVMSLNWLTHTVMTDPADMMYVHMDRENARKWSKGDLERYLQASTDVRAHQLTNRKDDNTFDKEFDSGMQFRLTYPTSSNLSGITVGRVWLIDYERMDDNVDGEGNPFDLAQMRTTTFKRFGMTVAEASPNPNKEIQDPKWTPGSPHEAPPIRGIFELYNRGDRRRWYWKCPHCEDAFEPDFKLLRYPDSADIMECREQTFMACPICGGILEPSMKDDLNWAGRWVKDGMIWTPEGAIVERNGMKAARSSIASFWMKGPAAAYQDWGQLVEKNLRALKAFEETGDDAPLRKTVTTDQGSFYIPQSRLSERSPEDLKNAAENWDTSEEEPTVPHGVRFIIATTDVQKTSFVVQMQGFTATGDMVVIDGYKCRLSNRFNGNGERLPIDPAAFGEDWDVLLDEVILKTYPLADGSGRRMRVRAVGCDSGGAEGVTGHAYNFWRRLRKRGDGLHRRFCLVKGESTKGAPHARTTWPDSNQKGKMAVAKGDVPVILLHSNLMKDRVSVMMARRIEDSGEDETVGGMLRYPDWMPAWFYAQMTTEIRTEKGWFNPRKRRNEAFDLAYYALGLAIRPYEQNVPFVTFNIDRLNYDEPPVWASKWDENELVFGGEVAAVKIEKPKPLTMAELAKKLA